MSINTNTLRPGLLVSLKTSIKGNIAYRKRDVENAHKTETGTEIAKWETTRRVEDPAEFEAAKTVRSKAWSIIAGVCAPTAFGLLCPEADSAELEEAINKAQALAAEFNATSSITKVSIFAITGRVAQDDVQAVKAINAEVRELLDDMKDGIEALDVKRVRDAANKARSLGQMLTPEANARITTAIEAARKTARDIVKAGEEAGQAIDKRSLRAISESRTAFLDLDEETKTVAAPKAEARAVDLVPDAEQSVRRPAKRTRAAAEV